MSEKKIRLRLQFFVFALLLIQFGDSTMSKSDVIEKSKEAVRWGEHMEGFVMSISLDENEVPSGESLFVTVRLKNVTGKSLRLEETRPEVDFKFAVEKRDMSFSEKRLFGEDVDELRYQRKLRDAEVSPETLEVAPGEQLEYRFNLSRRFDMTTPGEYTIQAQREVPGQKEEAAALLSSNEVTVNIQRRLGPISRERIWEWGEPREGAIMSISPKRQAVSAGMPFLLTIRILNFSKDSLHLPGDKLLMNFSFDVEDPSGEKLDELRNWRLRHVYSTSKRHRSVRPFETIKYRINLSRFFDFSTEGDYTIQAYRRIRKSEREEGESGLTRLYSNEATVTIQE